MKKHTLITITISLLLSLGGCQSVKPVSKEASPSLFEQSYLEAASKADKTNNNAFDSDESERKRKLIEALSFTERMPTTQLYTFNDYCLQVCDIWFEPNYTFSEFFRNIVASQYRWEYEIDPLKRYSFEESESIDFKLDCFTIFTITVLNMCTDKEAHLIDDLWVSEVYVNDDFSNAMYTSFGLCLDGTNVESYDEFILNHKVDNNSIIKKNDKCIVTYAKTIDLYKLVGNDGLMIEKYMPCYSFVFNATSGECEKIRLDLNNFTLKDTHL